MKKQLYVPSMNQISWNSRPSLLYITLVHLGLSRPFIRCLYSWAFPVSGKITVFMNPGWMVTFTVVLLAVDQYSPIGRTVVDDGKRFAIGILSAIIATWFSI